MGILQSKSARNLVAYYTFQLEKNGYDTSPIIEGSLSYDTTVTKNNESFKILVFYDQKGLKTVVQGNKDSEHYWKIYDIIYGESFASKRRPVFIEPESYIGTFESGKGDYFGPLIVCGVYLNKNTSNELKKLKVKETKDFTEEQFIKLAEKIKQVIGNDAFHIFTLYPQEYNNKHIEYKNIHNLLGLGHSTVIKEITKNIDCLEVITEKFGKDGIIQEFLKDYDKKINLKQVTRSDRYTAVAAASIITRIESNKWFQEINNRFNCELTKGASMLVGQNVIPIVEEHTSEILSEIAKLHFKTTRKLEKRFKIKLVPRDEEIEKLTEEDISDNNSELNEEQD